MNTANMKEIPRTNIYLAISLNIITLGIYSIYWLHKKIIFLNKTSRKQKIPHLFIYLCYGFLFIYILKFFNIAILSHGFYSLYFIFKIILLFAVRKKIHQFCEISPHSSHWLNAAWTFIFGFLYLIYKIDLFPHNLKTPSNQDQSA